MNHERYNAWLHWSVTNRCNIDCAFCFYNQTAGGIESKRSDPAKEIDIPALIKTLNGSGKVFRIGFTGGEPFLVPNFVEACEEISKRHYISINTNATSRRVERFCHEIDPDRVESIIVSIHVTEIERLGLIDSTIRNIEHFKSRGFKLDVRETAYPPFTREVDRIKNLLLGHGVNISFTDYHGIWNQKKYPESYTDSEVRIFGLDRKTNSNKNQYHQFKTLCNAGYNFGIVYENGDIYPCYRVKERMGNIYESISFGKEMTTCPSLYCECPFKVFDTYLFNKARKESLRIKHTASVFKSKVVLPSDQKSLGRGSATGKKMNIGKTYCILTNRIDTRDDESQFAWIRGYRLIRKHTRFVLPVLEDGIFDVIQFESSEVVDGFARALRNRIGYGSKTKLILSIALDSKGAVIAKNDTAFMQAVESVDAFVTDSENIMNKFSVTTNKPVFYDPSLYQGTREAKMNGRKARLVASSFSRFLDCITGDSKNPKSFKNKAAPVCNNTLRYGFKSHSKGKICIERGPLFEHHRSGWEFAIRSIRSLHNEKGIIFDGCLEQTFLWDEKTNIGGKLIPYTSPWVGFFHNPPWIPHWFSPNNAPADLIKKESFQKSLESCIGLFALSEHLGRLLRIETGKPVSILYHPTENPAKKFNFGSFLRNSEKRIINIGWWLRRLTSIYLLPLDKDTGYTKVRLLPFTGDDDPKRKTVDRIMKDEVSRFSLRFDRGFYENTEIVEYMNPEEYDRVLTNNICFLDLYDASANNAVIECITRCTPLLVNPIPPVVEYLGPDYPLYFNTLNEAAEKALDLALIKETNEYLKSWHVKKKITGAYFLWSFERSDVYRAIQ